MTFLTKLLVCACTLAVLDAYKTFQDRIPNGDRIPHPCKPNFRWQGVGHKSMAGGGARNKFGVDFAANGMKWDKCICERDSDGDGRTNGEELGDPNCLWPEGGNSVLTEPTSHPGICEPIDDPNCMQTNDWSFCESTDEFECKAIENNPDLKVVEIRYPKTPVPAKETSYYCMTFDLPDDAEYHLIADEPLIDNEYVMHHILLYGCDEPEDGNMDWKLSEPAECGMSMQTCSKIIGLWTIGVNGRCLTQEYGYRVGLKGIKTINMQFHWDNPERRTDYTDATGMKLYLTKSLRPNDAGTLQFGDYYLQIPPRMESHSEEGYCRAACTENIPHTIYFKEFIFHMHYLGYSSAIEHIRDGQVINLIEAKSYSYDNPDIVTFDQAIEFLAGDELKITCNYKSTAKSTTTYYGDGTSEEMCFGFLSYYPALDSFDLCMSYESLDMCPPNNNPSPLGACNYTTFFAKAEPLVTEVLTTCGIPPSCTDGCRTVIDKKRREEPCLQGDLGMFTEYQIIKNTFGEYAKSFIEAMHTCDDEWDKGIIYKGQNEPKDPNETIDKDKPRYTTRKPGYSQCVFDPVSSSSFTLPNFGMVICGLVTAVAKNILN